MLKILLGYVSKHAPEDVKRHEFINSRQNGPNGINLRTHFLLKPLLKHHPTNSNSLLILKTLNLGLLKHK